MNCRDIEPLLSAERDGMLTASQHSALESHVASCTACARLRAGFSRAMDVFKRDAATVAVPDADEEWEKLRASLGGGETRKRERRPVAPLLWFAAPLAAAAALAFAFFSSNPAPQSTGESVATSGEVAQAEYVEPGDAKASTIVYVDKDSGWLVVWATNGDSDSKK